MKFGQLSAHIINAANQSELFYSAQGQSALTIQLVNPSAPAKVSIAHVPAGYSLQIKHFFIAKTIDSDYRSDKYLLNAGDSLYVKSSAAGVIVTTNGIEQ